MKKIMAAQPGWFIAVFGEGAIYKQPVVAWKVSGRRNKPFAVVDPIGITCLDRDNCWEISNNTYLQSPEGKFYSSGIEGLVFDDEAAAHEHWKNIKKDRRPVVVEHKVARSQNGEAT